ncbi:protein cortex [Ptiloglossa arizonensis]|uniref:protein cortex n=1 Tax=Ptiloglossa arizonensis TaxID=3350558 RepID=UPI003F9FB626
MLDEKSSIVHINSLRYRHGCLQEQVQGLEGHRYWLDDLNRTRCSLGITFRILRSSRFLSSSFPCKLQDKHSRFLNQDCNFCKKKTRINVVEFQKMFIFFETFFCILCFSLFLKEIFQVLLCNAKHLDYLIELGTLCSDNRSCVSSKIRTSDYQSALSLGSTIVKIYPLFRKQNYSEDRFIIRRRKYNFEAANYLLKREAPIQPQNNHLDVLEQVNSLSKRWRRKYMHQLMVKENVIPGLRQKGVLRGNHLSAENKLPGNLAGLPKDRWDEEYFEDGMWKSKPRKKPILYSMDSILEVPGIERSLQSRYRLIDWSSRNIVAAATWESVVFIDTCMFQSVKPLEKVKSSTLCILKWSNAGEKLAICSLSASIKVYCIQVKKVIWSVKCHAMSEFNSLCYVRCLCWSHDDKLIVTGCMGVITVYSVINGSVVNSTVAHSTVILTLAFSANYQYLVSSAMDMNIRVLLWPSLAALLDITYYEPVKALAWHPHESDLLCIGGGLGDASLSLWNVNKLDPVSYRLVPFNGAVENLAWNKLSGELTVHWSYWEEQKQYTVIPVFASLDQIVDAVPVDKDWQIKSMMWNADHTQLAIYSNEVLSIWNFFGNEYNYHRKRQEQCKNLKTQESAGSRSFNEFCHFIIR